MKILIALASLTIPLLGFADTVVPVDAVESYVNIRQSPEAGADVVGRLQQGTSLPFVATTDGWNEVRLENGESGFIHADWTVVVVAEPEAAIAQVVEETVVEEAVVEEAAAVLEDSVVEEATEVVEESVIEEAAEVVEESVEEEMAEVVEESVALIGASGPMGPPGPMGPAGADGAGAIKGDPDYLVKFKDETVGTSSQIYDNGNQIGIGTAEPQQRLEVNGSIQIHDQNSGVAGLMITQSDGDTGYIMHNRASTLTIGAGSVDRITVDRDGNVGIGESRPSQPLQMASGAHVTAGGVWTNSSSRAKKENIDALTLEDALATLARLEPVHFNYISDATEAHVGFIAEDVPDLVAMTDREGLSSMDIVAVLTKVIQAQQQQIDALEQRLDAAE